MVNKRNGETNEMRKQERKKRKYKKAVLSGTRLRKNRQLFGLARRFRARYSDGYRETGRKSKETGGTKKMKRIIGQIMTLGAYDSWQQLSLKEKLLFLLGYPAMLAAYYIAGSLLK